MVSRIPCIFRSLQQNIVPSICDLFSCAARHHHRHLFTNSRPHPTPSTPPDHQTPDHETLFAQREQQSCCHPDTKTLRSTSFPLKHRYPLGARLHHKKYFAPCQP